MAGKWRDSAAATSFWSRTAIGATLSVPDHKEVAKGILRSLIRSSGLSVEKFIEFAN
jgi:hypothetical protein